jgi:hypothetical protein
VLFDVNASTRALQAVQIDSELGVCKPGDANWELAQKIALCAATTHVSLVRHFNWVHLAAGGPLAIATRNSLPAKHPIRRLLWPHVYRTQYSNQIVTKGQLVKGGDFETTFSFTHRGVCQLFEESYKEYDITVIDPAKDAEQRCIKEGGFATPSLENRQAHFDLMFRHAERYLGLYYGTDRKLCEDEYLKTWINELDRLIPGGIRKLLTDGLTIETVGRLIGAFIYLASVEHEILGTGLWNYQLWTRVQPVRIYKNGQREPMDVYQRLVNANFNLNVRRTPLMSDFSYLALDHAGAALFRAFQDELRTLQAKLDEEPFACWKIYPKLLEANINA